MLKRWEPMILTKKLHVEILRNITESLNPKHKKIIYKNNLHLRDYWYYWMYFLMSNCCSWSWKSLRLLYVVISKTWYLSFFFCMLNDDFSIFFYQKEIVVQCCSIKIGHFNTSFNSTTKNVTSHFISPFNVLSFH